MYKINLSDHSFIVADEDYVLRVFYGLFSRRVTVKTLLGMNYSKYYLLDLVDGKKIKRTFSIEKNYETDIPSGSRIKMSQDIQEGDLVKGVNGAERVAELHTGVDNMYEISVNGSTYTVNGGHILHLIDKETKEPLDMPVNIYILMDDDFKSHFTMEVVNEDE